MHKTFYMVKGAGPHGPTAISTGGRRTETAVATVKRDSRERPASFNL